MPLTHTRSPRFLLVAFISALTVLACAWLVPSAARWTPDGRSDSGFIVETPHPFLPPTRHPDDPILTPTPDAPRQLPTVRSEALEYVVKAGDTLGKIAQRYAVGLGAVLETNPIANPDLLQVGQTLIIPPPTPMPPAPAFKIIPDSELVYSPACVDFDLEGFVAYHSGYLSRYAEAVEDVEHSGAEIVARVAREYSVNPRILLAVLEHQSGWVTRGQPDERERLFPLGVIEEQRVGLYSQLAWAANSLNRGYYLWKVNAISGWLLLDGSMVPANPSINAGTAGVQHLMGGLSGYSEWITAVTEGGVFNTFFRLFGYSFDVAIEPLLPDNLIQPGMQLPFEQGEIWSFTGGPHGGWGDGSAWAGIDFAPPGEALGCVPSDAWVLAMADGIVIRSENGVVVQDLKGDGIEQTGWTILYLHIDSQNRVAAGTYLRAGDRIGHPSCEGGYSTGTHVHIARRYNGEWISADGSIPFVMDGWVSEGTGVVYNGYLKRNGEVVEAWNGRRQENQISR